ncbi:MAG TPA: hypothetical protein VGN17_00175 [Bryobacteraceae bacterium]|jgi:hypothetical protein
MTGLQRGLLVGGFQLALVLSMAGKYAVDRQTLPRVWVRVTPYDPNLPVRGRYVRLQVHTALRGAMTNKVVLYGSAELSIDNGQLIATSTDADTGVQVYRDTDSTATLTEPVAYFIPEHGPDPSRRPEGEELWAEVSIPKRGPPRPVRLGVKRTGKIVPLDLN